VAERSDPTPGGPHPGLCAGLLALATFLLYLGVRANGFVAYDDGTYVVQNPFVAGGLGAEGIGWALTSASYACNWHPVTWLSHMLDVSLFGMEPAGHHLHAALLHAANAALCFLALRALTRATWESFLVALLFAVHPLRVESVAWVSERKDLLAGTWFFLTLLAYAGSVARPGKGRRALVAIALAIGLAAKPMLVTLPFLLLVLDRWPLGRTESLPVLVREKLPLFVLSALSCVITLVAQSAGGCTGFIEEGVATGSRVGNAAVAYAQYVEKALWPTDLSVFYPHPAVVDPGTSRAGAMALALVLLVSISAGTLALRARVPALIAGWLWFLGLLVPVLGVVQVGGQALADRYAYLPLVGLQVMAVWGGAALARRSRALRAPLLLATALVTALFAVLTTRQVEVWHSTRTLFEHALDVTDRNYVAHTNLGRLAGDAGDYAAARAHFEAAVEADPNFYESRLNLGWSLNLQGAPQEGLPHLERAVALRPDEAAGHFKLALVLGNLGRYPEAEEELLETRRLDPDHPTVEQAFEEIRRRAGR